MKVNLRLWFTGLLIAALEITSVNSWIIFLFINKYDPQASSTIVGPNATFI